MPRTEVYQLRLSKQEKDELANRAREQGISIAKLIRQRLKLDAEVVVAAPRSGKTTAMVADDLLAARVNELSMRMPRSNAERLARRELA